MFLSKNSKRNLSKYFVALIIITSSIKVFGYAYFFIIFSPFIFLQKNLILNNFKNLLFTNKVVIFYFFILSISAIIGAFKINDLRIIIFWIPLFIFVASIYIINITLKDNRKDYINLLYSSSIIYFIYYALMTVFSFIFFGNQFDIQDNLWIGSSVAFSISPILLYPLYIKWEEINFKLNSNYLVVLLLFNFFVLLHESRIGKLYFFTITIFIFLQNIKLKKLFNAFLILIICTFFYSINSNFKSEINDYFYKDSSNIPPVNITQDIKALTKGISKLNFIGMGNEKEIGGNKARVIELKIGFSHFKNLPLQNKIFGTGWYSSRIDISQTRNAIIDQYSEYNLPPEMLKAKKVDLQGFVALLLDTGIVGTTFTLILNLLFVFKIINFEKNIVNRLLLLTFFLLHILVLFIGYPFVNIIYLISFIPGGILDFPKKNYLKKQFQLVN